MGLPGRRVMLAYPRLAEAQLIGPAELLEIPLMTVVETPLGRMRGHREESVVHLRLLRYRGPAAPWSPRRPRDVPNRLPLRARGRHVTVARVAAAPAHGHVLALDRGDLVRGDGVPRRLHVDTV